MGLRISKPKVARITSKGQITIPKPVREQLKLEEGDRVVFVEEDGKMVVKKAALVAFEDFADSISEEAKEKGITEEEVLEELEKVRQEMWNERNRD